MKKPDVYLAGPIQHSDDSGKGWREKVQDMTSSVNFVNPHDKYEHDGVDDYDDVDASIEEIVELDKHMVLDSDALLVKEEDVPSRGTPMELQLAWTFNIPTIVVYEGTKLSAWVEYHADEVFTSLYSAVEHLEQEVSIYSSGNVAVENLGGTTNNMRVLEMPYLKVEMPNKGFMNVILDEELADPYIESVKQLATHTSFRKGRYL